MAYKNLKSYFLHHSCLIRAVIDIGTPESKGFKKHLKETFKAGFDDVIQKTQAEGRTFVSYKKTCIP